MDAPANPGATIELFKRKEPDMAKTVEELEKALAEQATQAEELKKQLAAATEEVEKGKKTWAQVKALEATNKELSEKLKGYMEDEEEEEEDDEVEMKKRAEQAELKKRLDSAEATIQKQADTIAKMQDEAVTADLTAYVQKTYPNIAAAEYADIVKSLRALDGNEGARKTFEKALKAQNDAITDALKTRGVDHVSIDGGAFDKATALAKQKMEKDPKAFDTIHKARSAVWQENPDLKKEYDEERNSRSRRSAA